MSKIDELREIPGGFHVWSIANQANIQLTTSTIVKIKHTCYGNSVVFVKPMQLIFNMPGQIPTVIEQGTDEWSIDYNKTVPYEVPKPEGI